MPGLAADLRRLGLAVVDDPDVLAGAVVDWTGRFRGWTPALVRPRDAGEVSRLLAWCSAHAVAVVPQGGRTGLVGGGVPLDGEVVVSLVGLDGCGPVDTLAAQVTAGAGVTLAGLQAHAERAGLAYGVDLAARDSATVGGTVATNAGGTRVLRHGHTRAQVLGVEAVLADGSVLRRLDGLEKDNTGYDLAGLLVGSEGTLGVVTAARLRLVPGRAERVVALLAVRSVAEAVVVASQLRVALDDLDALEVVLGGALALVARELALPLPFDPPPAVTVLVECAGRTDPTPALAAAVADLGEQVAGAVVAADPSGRARLWAYRDRVSEAVARTGVPHKLDVTVPLARLATFAAEVDAAVAGVAPAAAVHLFGHLGDGNLHVNVVGVAAEDDAVDDAVLRLAVSLGGSISAEHGIGRAKRRWLPLQRSPEELAAMRAIKRALDPAGILNPAALLGPNPGSLSPATAPGTRAPGAGPPAGRS